MFLQYFDTVGWVFWPVKTVGRITYTVLMETLNPAQSINHWYTSCLRLSETVIFCPHVGLGCCRISPSRFLVEYFRIGLNWWNIWANHRVSKRIIAKAPNVLYALVLWERKCLQRCPKLVMLWLVSLNSLGKEFHSLGPSTENAKKATRVQTAYRVNQLSTIS